MQSRSTGFASSCLLWLILFGVLVSCLCPSAMFIGGFAATLQADSVAGIVEPYLCPEGSRAEIVTYKVIPRRNSYDYELQCVAANGDIIREPSPDYAFYWLAALVVGVVILASVLALLLTVPVGVLIARRGSRPQAAQSLKPPE